MKAKTHTRQTESNFPPALTDPVTHVPASRMQKSTDISIQ